MEPSKDVKLHTTPIKPKRSYYQLFEKWKDFAFAAPALIFLGIFVYYPLLYSLFLSFTNWNMAKPAWKMIGTENYEKLLVSEEFYKVLGITFKYTLIDVVLTLVLGLLLALLLNSTRKIYSFMRMIVFMPYYISMVIAAMIFVWIFNTQYGIANMVIGWFGYDAVNWLNNPNTALWSLIIVSLWKSVGFAMLIFIAGLRGIPVEYYEASSIDGASKVKQFIRITLPLLSPITLFLVVTNFISSMQVFQSINVMTLGGPLDSTKAMVYWIYEMAFKEFKTGRASALVIIFFVIIIIFTIIQFVVSKKRVHYEG
ncbi:sugar ABC transporter permease [Paenibacillus sp. N1-5-1-14]|uniref:carbohydrate ABC transporter permease n=1 Tax=Paenibacillus radicibacter TaxID=2972488 RepID=UPI0021590A34|nr:sugar ABC transporter permease [Paenibacillus radicibacter]MCR8643842.1 sugar ABC transporter permease [Paenibacillus radicibacter]